MNIWVRSIAIGAFLTAISYILGYGLGWITIINYLEVAAVFTTYVQVFMCVHQTRWNYPVGVLTTFLYSWLFWQWEMYALAAFNLYLVLSLAYGWFRWGPDDTTRPVGRIRGYEKYLYPGVALILTVALVYVREHYGLVMTDMEIWITVLSGVAQVMLDNKRIENWIFWIGVNVLSIYFYFNGGLYLVTFQYIFLLGNAFYGLVQWYKTWESARI